MKLHILAVGTKMPSWVSEGYAEYEKRLPREWKPALKELAVARRGKSGAVAQYCEQEGQQILANLPASAHVVALDVLGKAYSTEQLSERMARWQMAGPDVYLLIGGPDGLSPECLSRANERFSLSALTLPHPLVRVVLIEQLYRGWTLLNNHPYHK